MTELAPAARSLAGLRPIDASLAPLPPMISTDAHVMEPQALWDQLPPRLRENVPVLRFGDVPAGGSDPHARLIDQESDGVQAEILFPNDGLAIFGIDDVETQREAFRLYNEWIAAFCRVSPHRFFGVPALSVYDIEGAIAEMHRALDMGLTGIMIWQVPDPRLPFTSGHYERLWAAAAEANAPVHTHILTGHNYMKKGGLMTEDRVERVRNAVNVKQNDTINALFDLIFSGVFDRHPKLKLVLAESEVGWLPFVLQQWDYYFNRFGGSEKIPIERKPSQIFEEQVFCTWLEDFSGTRQFSWFGQNNCMWSNDYPHFNMTFPHSRENVQRHIGDLPRELQIKLIRGNALRLYGFDL